MQTKGWYWWDKDMEADVFVYISTDPRQIRVVESGSHIPLPLTWEFA